MKMKMKNTNISMLENAHVTIFTFYLQLKTMNLLKTDSKQV